MVGMQTTGEPRIQILCLLLQLVGKAENRTLLAQAAYKRYFDYKVRVTKRFNEGHMVFLDINKNELKICKESDEQSTTSKLLPKSIGGPFRVIRAYPDAFDVDQEPPSFQYPWNTDLKPPLKIPPTTIQTSIPI